MAAYYLLLIILYFTQEDMRIMRSVFLVFESRLSECISKFLDDYCVMNSNCIPPVKQWIVLCNNDPCLYIDNIPLCENDLCFEDLGIPPLLSYMENPVVWSVDISGRHDGTTEVMGLATALLSEFPIHLMDDYTNHFWTLEEITDNKKIEGHCFFDHIGW